MGGLFDRTNSIEDEKIFHFHGDRSLNKVD